MNQIREEGMAEIQHNSVSSPSHYTFAGKVYEVINVVEAWGMGFHLGNAIKYIARADHKINPIQDLEKARWYLDREIQNRKDAAEKDRREQEAEVEKWAQEAARQKRIQLRAQKNKKAAKRNGK